MGISFYDVANEDKLITTWDNPVFENYIIALQFSENDPSIPKTEIVNMEPYGWKGIVASSLQKAAEELAKETAKYGKARHVILFSHGGVASGISLVENQYVAIQQTSFTTINGTDNDLRGIYYLRRKRLEEEIPREEKEAEEKYKNDQQARLERQAEREKKISTLKSGSEAYYDNWREIDIDNQQAQEEEQEYNAFKCRIEEEKKRLNTILTSQRKADMAAMNSLIGCIADNRYLILASCNSALENSLIEEIMKDTGYRINIAGIKYKANYSKDENTGKMDGNILIGKKNLKDKNFRFFLAEEPNNEVLVFRPNKHITSYTNIEVLRDDLNFE